MDQMPGSDGTVLSATEYLTFNAIIDRLTYPDLRRELSSAIRKVHYPQGLSALDAWQRRTREIWRTT